jgi:hypothetical protein
MVKCSVPARPLSQKQRGEDHSMERISEGTGHAQSRSARRSGDVCPALVLAVKVVCDKSDIKHEPNSLHVREFCTTELHRCCSLWHPGSNGAEAAPAGQSSGMATLDLPA